MKLALTVTLLSACGLAQTLTTVSDTIVNSDGSNPTGTATISWQRTLNSARQVTYPGSKTITITNGVINTQLLPNDTALPPATCYTVNYTLNGVNSRRYWFVPTSATAVNLARVEGNVPCSTQSGALVAPAQITGGPAVTTDVLTSVNGVVGWAPPSATSLVGLPFINATQTPCNAPTDGVTDATAAIQCAVGLSINSAIAPLIFGAPSIPVTLTSNTFVVSRPINACQAVLLSSVKYQICAPVYGQGTTNTVFLPSPSFPTEDVTPSSAVFVTDVGTVHAFTNQNASPDFRDFTIAFRQPWSSISTRSQIKQWRAFNLNNTMGPRLSNIEIQQAWDGVSYKGTWDGSSWIQPVGRGVFQDLHISSFNTAIDMDGVLDTNYISRLHVWPFGTDFTDPTLLYSQNPNSIGIRSGRNDGTMLDAATFLNGAAIQLIAGADRGGTVLRVENTDFDGGTGIVTATGSYAGVGHIVTVSNSDFFFSPPAGWPASSFTAINHTHGFLSVTGGTIDITTAATGVAPISIPGDASGASMTASFTGVHFIMNNLGTTKLIQQPDNTGGFLQLQMNITGCSFFSDANPRTAPLVSVEQTSSGTAKMVFVGNTVTNALASGDLLLAISKDDFHVVKSYSAPGWSISLPSVALGPGGFFNSDISLPDGSTPQLLLASPTSSNYQVSISTNSSNTFFSAKSNTPGWVFQNNNGGLIQAQIDAFGNFTAAGVIGELVVNFSGLGTPLAAGKHLYCNNCTTAATCASGGTGHMAVSNGTAWTCQ